MEDAPFVQPSRETHSSWSAFKQYFGQWVNLKVLLGCSIAWFALDVAFYGINLNQSVVLTAIGYAPKGASPFDTLFSLSVGNLIINLMGTGMLSPLFFEKSDNQSSSRLLGHGLFN